MDLILAFVQTDIRKITILYLYIYFVCFSRCHVRLYAVRDIIFKIVVVRSSEYVVSNE